MIFATAFCRSRKIPLVLAAAVLISFAASGVCEETEASKAARRAYWAALDFYKANTNRLQPAWEFARACFNVGEFATNSTERAAVAGEGIAAARKAVSLDPDSPAAHYYLGMNLGQLARTRGIGALKLVILLEKEFLRTAELDPLWDHAGPHRTLGVLYRDAPSIASVGNRTKSKQHLEKAVELSPEYPENYIALLEASLIWHDRNTAARVMKSLEKLLPEARKQFSGPAWTSSWEDWDARVKAIQRKLAPARVLEAPGHKD